MALMTPSEEKPIPRPAGCVVLVLFMVMLWLSCVMLSALVLEPREQRMAALAWNEVPCRIQKLEIAARSSSTRSARSSVGYEPQVVFEYEVSGQKYVGERFWLGGTLFNTRAEAAQIIAPYQNRAQSVCYVDPQRPQNAVLSRRLYDEAWVGWMWLVLFGLLGAAGCATAIWTIFFPRRLYAPSGGLVPATVGEVVFGWIAALAWNGVFSMLFVRACLRGQPPSMLVELLGFPFIGALLAAGASLKTWQYWHAKTPVAPSRFD